MSDQKPALTIIPEQIPQRGGCAVVLHLRGDVDALTFPHLLAAIEMGFKEEGTLGVVLDAERLGYASSAALAVLASMADKNVNEEVTGPLIALAPTSLKRNLRLLGYQKALKPYRSIEEALRQLRRVRRSRSRASQDPDV